MPRNDLKPWEPQSLPTLRHWIEAVIGFMGRLFEHHAPSFATVGFDGSIARGMVHSMPSHAAAIARGEGGPLLTAIEDFWNGFKRQGEKLVENSDAIGRASCRERVCKYV